MWWRINEVYEKLVLQHITLEDAIIKFINYSKKKKNLPHQVYAIFDKTLPYQNLFQTGKKKWEKKC